MTDQIMKQRAAYIVKTLIDHHYEAYWVGGYVRDQLIGRATQDIDIATSAKPEQVMSIFEKCKPTGLQHGTVMVIIEGTPFEVTTFRIESAYDNYRSPSEVAFIENLEGDLSRRDFTMNAMAMDQSGVLIDPFGGQADLRNNILRCVGDPYIRFGEDALRMMRCIRFAAEYSLHIDEWTWKALLQQAPLLAHIAMERVRSELERIVMGKHIGLGLYLFVESGLFRYLKTDIHINFERITNVEQKVLTGWLSSWEDPNIRLALLFLVMDTSAEAALAAMRTLTFANQQFTEVTDILRFHEWLLKELDIPAKRMNLALTLKLGALKYGASVSEQWLQLITVVHEWIVEQSSFPVEWQQLAESGGQWLLELHVTSLKQLQINGSDIVKAGCTPGPRIGHVLEILLEETALGLVDNDKKQLMLRATELVAEEE